MFNQAISTSDLPSLAVLVFLECALSIDNALIIASIVHKLPSHQQQRSIWIGSFSSLILRAGVIGGASFFIHNHVVQLLGALYLAYLAVRGLFFKPKQASERKLSSSFWANVVKIELLDLIFAIDSILAAIAFTGAAADKLWMVYLGGVIGLVAMRFLTGRLLYFFTKLPYLDKVAHVIIALVAIKLGHQALQ